MWKAGREVPEEGEGRLKTWALFFGLVFPFCHSERPLDRGEEQGMKQSRGKVKRGRSRPWQ